MGNRALRIDEGVAWNIDQRLRLLIESVQDYAIFMLDPEGVVVSWNVGAERMKGYSAAEIVGKHFSTFYPPGRGLLWKM